VRQLREQRAKEMAAKSNKPVRLTPKPESSAKPVVTAAKSQSEQFDRVAYQREYMRKRRAKVRATKEAGPASSTGQ
jgi:hypothetical protein